MAEEQTKPSEDWMNKKWRPMMGWTYMGTCIADFVIFPILWSLLQAMLKHPVTTWQPLTLQGAGLYHVAMGAVLGIAAFGRTQEKISGTAVVPGPLPPPSVPAVVAQNVPAPQPVVAPPPQTTVSPAVSGIAAGKKAPPPAEEPLI